MGKTMTKEKARRGGAGFMAGVWLVFLLALTLPGGEAEAQTGAEAADHGSQTEPVILSLPEAVRTALRQSRDMQDARLALVEAEERVDEAWGSVFPKIDLSASYTRNIAPMVSFLPAEIFGGEAGDFLKVRFGADNAWSTALVLDQPLFAASAFIGVGAAGRFKALQEETVRGRAQTLVTRVRLAYYDLLLAQEEQRLIENSVGRVRLSLEETEALNRAGIASLDPNEGRGQPRVCDG